MDGIVPVCKALKVQVLSGVGGGIGQLPVSWVISGSWIPFINLDHEEDIYYNVKIFA